LGSQTETVATMRSTSPWTYGPWLDLVVGCGGWSLPLLIIATWLTPSHTHAWLVGFYLLAVIFNYPHFMATVYRAYHTRENFEKYKILTLHVTLLVVLTGVMLHASYQLLPWVFTLYICWSPWHYTGQNYGLLMMLARRTGATVTATERRWMRAAFVASYLMLIASFETGGSGDPLILSLGLPGKFTLPARLVLGAGFALFSFLGFRQLVARSGLRAMAAPLTLAFTQFLWFVLPTLLELHAAYQVPQTRYSSGILAVLHSAQYLWITSYYQQREARAAGQSNWRMAGYFLTLIAGGIALFIPGPWLVSYLFRFDFTTSFLIFTALVNIHHFILDGAVWKLRDSRVASLLIDSSGKPAASETPRASAKKRKPATNAAKRLFKAPAFRVIVVGALLIWGATEQIRFALGTDEGNLPALLRASRLNPYDSMVEARIALAEGKAGKGDEAVAALTRAVAINPHNVALQHTCARAMIENGQYQAAYEHYAKMLELFPRDVDALVNYGLLAARLGNPEEAISSWQKAVNVDPNQPNPHLYLAEAFDQKGEPAVAARHWEAYLKFAAAHPDDPVVGQAQQISATIQLADDDSRINRPDLAVPKYQSAIDLAQRAGDNKLGSLAFAHVADFQEKAGDTKSAAQSFQHGLALDAKANDPRSEAVDWFNYGQFLRRHGLPDDLAYACFLRAQSLLVNGNAPELAAVQTARQEIESRLGKKASASQKNLPNLLASASALPATSF
jgi:tetratricopeptide (TPR) repeat protein